MIIGQVKRINFGDQQPVCHFKYDPNKLKMVIECQPIKPYSLIDRVNVDRFEKQEQEQTDVNE